MALRAYSTVLLSGRDHRSLDGGPWPGERSARSRQARSAAEDGGRRLFCLARNAATSWQGKKAGVAVAGRRSRRSRPSGLIRPFEVAWDAPIKQTDGGHHGCYRRCRTRTGITGRTETCARASMKAKARPGERQRMVSHRGAADRAALDSRPAESNLRSRCHRWPIGPPRSTPRW